MAPLNEETRSGDARAFARAHNQLEAQVRNLQLQARRDVVAELIEELDEETTDRMIQWLDELVDFPGPDLVWRKILDALLPGLLVGLLMRLAGMDEEADAAVPSGPLLDPSEMQAMEAGGE